MVVIFKDRFVLRAAVGELAGRPFRDAESGWREELVFFSSAAYLISSSQLTWTTITVNVHFGIQEKLWKSAPLLAVLQRP